MNGPNEFIVIGNLKDCHRAARPGEISGPTLVTVGRSDEITPQCVDTIRQGLPDARLVQFESGSHAARPEDTDADLRVSRAPLADYECRG